MATFKVGTGKCTNQKYIGQVHRDDVLVWQTKRQYETREEAYRIANAARIRLEKLEG